MNVTEATKNVETDRTPGLESPSSASPPRARQIEQAGSVPKPPSLKSADGGQNADIRASSSTPLANINAARRPPPQSNASTRSHGSQLPQDVQARMKAFHLSRQGPPLPSTGSPLGIPDRPISNSRAPPSINEIPQAKSPIGPASLGVNPPTHAIASAETVSSPNGSSTPTIVSPTLNAPTTQTAPRKGLAAKRGLKMDMKLSNASGPLPTLKGSSADPPQNNPSEKLPASKDASSLFNKYSEYVDTKNGTLNFKGKAMIHDKGIEFSGGSSFSISLDEVDTLDELGKGNYGTVFKVRHSRPKIRRPGQGLSGNRAPSSRDTSEAIDSHRALETDDTNKALDSTTGIIMAMKEIRLELDEAKFAAIIMELDVLHRCVSPFIIDFYGAFFQEGAVYICMEYMDGGSIDKLYRGGVPEPVLRKITLAAVLGLKALKEEHNIIHRDVKPTNILMNTKGQIKICDFGVSGNLVASIAKTNIGCQSYMAPERISGGGMAQVSASAAGGTYSVQSDIWSLGLTIIECAMGQYPYPPETYDNIFSQLSVSNEKSCLRTSFNSYQAIVEGDPPDLPSDRFSNVAQDFVKGALNKIPKLRPTYAMLLRHPWLSALLKPPIITEEDEGIVQEGLNKTPNSPDVVDQELSEWVISAIEARRNKLPGNVHKAPALHAAPLSPQ